MSAESGPPIMVQVKPNGKPVGGAAVQPAISANGRYVTYTSKNLKVVGLPHSDARQVLRYDRRTGKTLLVSVTPGGASGERESGNATMSADGSIVAFVTQSGDLLPGSPELGSTYVTVVRDLDTGQTTLMSHTPTGGIPEQGSFDPLVSADGNLVTFRTSATDITGTAGAALFDRQTEQATAVTVQTTHGPLTPDESFISGDGQWIAFNSRDSGIVAGDDNGVNDVFLLNRATGDVTLVSRADDGTVADGDSRLLYQNNFSVSSAYPLTSADGSTVVFVSEASDLAGAANPSPGVYDEAYEFNVASGLSQLLTVLPNGEASHDIASAVTISPDGRYVGIETQAFLTGGTSGPGGPKIYVRDLKRQETRAASNDQMAQAPALGGRKPHVVFTIFGPLVPEDTDNDNDVYTRRIW